ncbi:MAG: flagellar protein FlgN [Pseudomonadota bacterium]
MMTTLIGALERLEKVLDQSIEAMTDRIGIDHTGIINDKSRALLALSRLASDITPAHLGEDAKAIVTRVRDKLASEQALLERRLDASRVVVDLIGDAVIASDWDGTYGPIPAYRTAGAHRP